MTFLFTFDKITATKLFFEVRKMMKKQKKRSFYPQSLRNKKKSQFGLVLQVIEKSRFRGGVFHKKCTVQKKITHQKIIKTTFYAFLRPEFQNVGVRAPLRARLEEHFLPRPP